MVAVILALSACAAQSRPDNSAAPGPGLFDGWADQPLPGAGQAVLRFRDEEFRFDELNTCGLVEHGRSFMFRGTGRDHAGRPVSLRIYRRMGEDRRALAVEEDSVQLSVRGDGNVWAHSLMRLRRPDPDEEVQSLSGRAAAWPAIGVRNDGLAAAVHGHMVRQPGAAAIVPDGEFRAAVHCRSSG